MFRTELEQRASSVKVYPPHNHRDCTSDIVTWRLHHEMCDRCGVPFVKMSPMADMIQHWTGACTWERTGPEQDPATVASMAVLELLQDISEVIPSNTIESNKMRIAIRLLRDFPRLLESCSGR